MEMLQSAPRDSIVIDLSCYKVSSHRDWVAVQFLELSDKSTRSAAVEAVLATLDKILQWVVVSPTLYQVYPLHISSTAEEPCRMPSGRPRNDSQSSATSYFEPAYTECTAELHWEQPWINGSPQWVRMGWQIKKVQNGEIVGIVDSRARSSGNLTTVSSWDVAGRRGRLMYRRRLRGGIKLLYVP
jgi:hypothetical protein